MPLSPVKALEMAASQFDSYAEQHTAKGTPEAEAKAAVNRDMAKIMRATIATMQSDKLVVTAKALVNLIEGANSHNFGNMRSLTSGARLKDTQEWVAFYVAAKGV